MKLIQIIQVLKNNFYIRRYQLHHESEVVQVHHVMITRELDQFNTLSCNRLGYLAG